MSHGPSHDDIFDSIRRDGPDIPIARPDATAVGQKQPKTTVREFARQSMRGLGRAGINAASLFPELMAAMAIGGVDPVVGPHILRPFIDKYFKNPQLEELDEYWGRPETGGGRGAALISELIGDAALTGGLIPKKVPGSAVTRAGERIRPIPGSGGRGFEVTGYRPLPPPPTAPSVTEILYGKPLPAPPKGIDKIAEAMRRSPGAQEAKLLDDMMNGVYTPPENLDWVSKIPGATPPSYTMPMDQVVNDLLRMGRQQATSGPGSLSSRGIMTSQDFKDILNLRAFGTRRGPFNSSGKSNMQIMDEIGADVAPVNPIASADDVARVNNRPPNRLDITDQMIDPQDPHVPKFAKEAQQEIRDMRRLENQATEALRDAIIDEGIPAYARTRMAPRIYDVMMGQPGRGPMPVVSVKPMNLMDMLIPSKYRRG